ncbi:MAG: hypothetical protein J6I54_00285 [Bacteroidaceae bacterium]|nr:hypothetical protein [Bacteroidaceae bacterium]
MDLFRPDLFFRYFVILFLAQYFVSPHYSRTVGISACSQMGETGVGDCTMPVLHIGRTHHHVARMQHLYGLTLYLGGG